MTKQRRWTKDIFKHFEANGFHPVDVQYGNGYFIFEHGKDMVIHFHIKELKGWKFGIWWKIDGEKSFDFFTQYERDIDKFKPTASTFVKNNVTLEDWYLKDLVEMCRFVKRHPYRAWVLDQTYPRDIWEWGTLDGCFKEYWKQWWKESVCYPHIYKRMNKRYLKLVRSIAYICLKNPQIQDLNENGNVCYPRYRVCCDDLTFEEAEPGFYGIDLKEQLQPWLLKKIARYNKKMEKYEKKYWQIAGISLGEELDVLVLGAKKAERRNRK